MKRMKDPENKFKLLEKELVGYLKMMGDAGDMIRVQDISDYPIFVIHQQHVEIGIPIAERGKVKGNWSVNASTLEEMVSKSVIEERKAEEFTKVFKNPEEHLCLFVLSELGAQFIFIKRKVK
jgi:hypothetical protein